ncbi:MAG: VOC family protein [Halococcoides sp.]
MNARAVDFVHYLVSDLDESVAFYRDVLGLTLDTKLDDVGWAELALDPTTIALEESPEVDPGGAAVAIAVDDVEAAVEELREHDVTISQEPFETPVCDMAHVTDPDGNPIVLHRRHDGTAGRRDPLP